MKGKIQPNDPAAVLSSFRKAGAAAGFQEEKFGEAAGHPLLALTKRTAGARPRIYLSAGIHGDEPASSLALLELLENGAFDGRADWFLCPLLNPGSLARGVRENPDGIDLNRDYREGKSGEARAHMDWLGRQPNFEVSICLHEDWEATGVYLYERAAAGRNGLAEEALAAAGRFLPIDRSPLIDGWEAREGIIRLGIDPAEIERWPESIYLLVHHHAVLHYTLETPSKAVLELRVAALQAAAEVVIRRFTEPVKPREGPEVLRPGSGEGPR